MYRSVRSAWAKAAVIVALMGSGVVMAGTAAAAAPANAGHGLEIAGTWVGSYVLPVDNGPLYAVSFGAKTPTGSYNGPLGEPSTTVARETGRLIDMESAVTDNTTQAEVAALVAKNFDLTHPNALWNLLSASERTSANALWAKAVAGAGPYTPGLSLPVNIQRGLAQTATVTVTSATGAPVAGASVSLSSTVATLGATTVVTGANGQASFTFTVPTGAAGSSYTIAASVSGVSDAARYLPTGSPTGRGALIGAGASSTQSASGTASFSTGRLAELSVTGIDGKAAVGLGYTVSLAGQSIASGSTSATPVVLGMLKEGATYQVALSGDAGAYLKVPTLTLPVGASVYQWSVALAKTPTLQVRWNRSGGSRVGSALSGRFTLSGNDGESGLASATLYGPSASCAERGGVVKHTKVAISSVATYSLGQIVIHRAGCYQWVVSVNLVPSGAAVQSVLRVQSQSAPVTPTTVPATTSTTTTTTTPPSTTTTWVAPTTTTTWVAPTTTTIPAGSKSGIAKFQNWLWLLLVLIVLLLIFTSRRRRE